MSDVKDFLRDVGYFGVGAAAVIIEAGGKAIKCLVRKGEKVLRENQDTVDEMKEKAREAGEKIKEAVKDLTAKPEPAVEEAPTEEAPIEDGAPVTPDAIYHTDEPVPVEDVMEDAAEAVAEETAETSDAVIADAEDDPKPENTIND